MTSSSANWPGIPLKVTRPCSISKNRCATCSAICAFCSTRKIVVPSRLSSRTILNISATIRGASPSDGSSMSSAGDREHLLLPAGERAGQLLVPFVQTWKAGIHPLEIGIDPDLVLALIGAREQIFAHAHLWEDEPVLGHERDAMRDDSGRRESDQLGAGEPDRAAARMQ